MHKENPSLDVEFLQQPRAAGEGRVGRAFGTMSGLKELALDPETTGLALRANAKVERGLVSPDTVRRAVEGDEPAFEKIIGTSDLLPAWFLEAGAQLSRAVCKIEASGVDEDGEDGSWAGTGFLVSPNIVLTNHHVLNSVQVARTSNCLFNYQVGQNGQPQPTKSFRLNPDRLFLTSPSKDGLDFTFVWVDGEPGREFGFFPLNRHAFTVVERECANVIQHPGGRPKAVVVQENQVVSQTAAVVHYTSDTEPGSSGSPVSTNEWKLSALHHASRRATAEELASLGASPDDATRRYLNEGIKFAAIASYLETITQGDSGRSSALEVLRLFRGTDAAMGFFGALGRGGEDAESPLEKVVNNYQGEAADVDAGFWNIEHFELHFQEKMEAVGEIITQMNLDVWSLEETSPQSIEALIEHLADKYSLSFKWLPSEPGASANKQTTSVIWNTKTVTCEAEEWPSEVREWLDVDSRDFDDLDLESIEGKVFPRRPRLFRVTTVNRGTGNEYSFYLVSLHLKAMGEGKKRRRMAAQILAAVVRTMIEKYGKGQDWILGGDYNAELNTGDFDALTSHGMVPISEKDEGEGAFSYVKGPKSLIDHIFLSPNLAASTTAADFFIVARDRELPDYTDISDHRPVLVRLSLGEDTHESARLREERTHAEEHREGSVLPASLRPWLHLDRRPPAPAASVPGAPVPSAGRHPGLEALEANRERVYYDAAADEAARTRYYGELPGGLDGSALYTRLGELVRTTHTQPRHYNPAVNVYPWVDLQPNRKLKSIYSGEEVDPERFILEDLEVDRKRERARELLEREAGLDFERAESLELLEASIRYNCEHVVPQSWFSRKEPMRGDVHHLFACEPKCNSFRGNIPYFEFADWEEKVQSDCGKRETQGFEPTAGKGAVARATLYFLLRYPGEINRNSHEYTEDRIRTLLEWHREEPPGDYERHRNAAIQELQGNRNPLIDFPDLAFQIDFERGLG